MKTIGLCLALLVVGCTPARRPGIEPRHLVLVTFQALRADRTSVYLHERPTTALASDEVERRENRALGVDDLAATGVVFENCMAPSPRAVPALASLFTGRSPAECGVEHDDEIVPSDVPTLAELFAHSGFHTAAFATDRELDLEVAVGRGFATFRTCTDDTATLAAALEWLRRDPGDGSRRFVWIHLSGLEPPFESGADAPDVEALVAQKNFGPEMPLEARRALLSGITALADAQRRQLANAYDHAVARASIALARTLRSAFDYTEPGADVSETWARTVLTFTAPTGVLLGEDGIFGQADSLHEHVLHVPLVLRHPDSLTGQRVSSAVVELRDLLPTFVEWFDLSTPERVQGRSLLALLDSYVERPFERRPSIAILPGHAVSARNEHFHLVLETSSTAQAPELALYEPARDPLERDDVSRHFPAAFAALRRAAADALGDTAHAYPLERRPPRPTEPSRRAAR